MPDPQFRQQHRPIDPEQVGGFLADQPRLLAVEVTVADIDGALNYGCRVVDLLDGTELARHCAPTEAASVGEFAALSWGLHQVAEVDPDARVVLRAPAALAARLGVEELTDPTAVAAVARG